MRSSPVITLVMFTISCAVSAQEAQQRKISSFFPQNYTHEYFLDLDALQDSELWDLVERALIAKPLFQMFRQEYGFALTDLKSLHGTMVEVGEGAERRQVEAHVYRGLKPLKLPPIGNQGRSMYRQRSATRVHGRDAVQEGKDAVEENLARFYQPKIYVLADAKTLVFGNKSHLSDILGGKTRGGVPHPNLLALTAGKRPLGYMGMKWSEGVPVPKDWLVDADPVSFAIVRAAFVGEDEHLVISVRARFLDGKQGPAQLRAAAETALEKFVADKQFAILKPLVAKLNFAIEHTDLVATLDLGDRRSVAKMLDIAVAIMTLMRREVSSQAAIDMKKAVEARQAALEAAKAALQKAQDKKKDR